MNQIITLTTLFIALFIIQFAFFLAKTAAMERRVDYMIKYCIIRPPAWALSRRIFIPFPPRLARGFCFQATVRNFRLVASQ